jgi:4-amino-4-deoxy-L-arabinose transferase-like glycosyltransferase
MTVRAPTWFERPLALRAAVLALSSAALGHGLWTAGALHPLDDCTYAALARNIVDSGDWLPLSYHGGAFWQHGPFVPWLTAIAFQFFGPSDDAARAVSILFAIATVWLAAAAARRLASVLFPPDPADPHATLRAELVGVAAAIILLGTEPFLRFGGRARLDAALTFFVLGSVYAAARAMGGERRYHYVAGLCVGLAIYAKGVAALLVLPGLALAPLLARTPRIFADKHLAGGVLLAIALPAPWLAWVLLHHRDAFIDEYLLKFVGGVWTTGRAMEPQPWWRTIADLATSYWPWLPVLLLAIARAFHDAVRKRRASLAAYAASIVFGLAIVSALSTKYPHYVLPLYPLMAVLGAVELARLLRSARTTTLWWLSRGAFVLATAGVALFASGVVRMHSSAIGEHYKALAAPITAAVPAGARLAFEGPDVWSTISAVEYYARRVADPLPAGTDPAEWLARERRPLLVTEDVRRRHPRLAALAAPCGQAGSMILLCAHRAR